MNHVVTVSPALRFQSAPRLVGRSTSRTHSVMTSLGRFQSAPRLVGRSTSREGRGVIKQTPKVSIRSPPRGEVDHPPCARWSMLAGLVVSIRSPPRGEVDCRSRFRYVPLRWFQSAPRLVGRSTLGEARLTKLDCLVSIRSPPRGEVDLTFFPKLPVAVPKFQSAPRLVGRSTSRSFPSFRWRCPSFNPLPASWGGRRQALARSALSAVSCFNPLPASWGGRLSRWRRNWRTQHDVSIRSPPRGEVDSRRVTDDEERSWWFQSAPRLVGRSTYALGFRAVLAGVRFNPLPASWGGRRPEGP